ncbi:hypothetical protein MNVM_21370 [Mycobacterium novum]|nr:hypothetical protein MNVM_21370 [Mycobacterium novum]
MMTSALYDDTTSAPGLSQLEPLLEIERHHRVAVINAPADSALRLLPNSRANPGHADAVIAFATRRVELAFLRAAYNAAGSGRTAWLVYCEPGQPGTDLRWEWLLAALRQYGVQAVRHVRIDPGWSAVLLQRRRSGEAEPGLVG